MPSETDMLRKAERARPSRAGGAGRRGKRHYPALGLALALVCGAVLAAHWPVIGARALFLDDHQYVIENPLVRICGWDSVGRFLGEVRKPSTVAGYYQPLTMISLMLDCAAGASPSNLRPFHCTSLALHAGNTALVVLLLYELFGSVWAAAGIGLLFGLHPMTVEPIAWVTERKTLLAAFFTLASLVVYVWNLRRPARTRYVACLVLFGLALLSKPTSTPLPVLLLLLDWWPLRRLSWRSVAEKVPFFVLAGFSAAITLISQHSAAGLDAPTQGHPQAIALVMCHNLALYLAHIVWPVGLSPHYPFPHRLELWQPMVLGGVVGVALLAIVLAVSLRWTSALAAGVLFFLIALLPTSEIVGFTYVIGADKYVYLAALGLMLIAAAAVARWLSAPRGSVAVAGGSSGKRRLLAAGAVMALLAVAEAHAARGYIAHWRDTEGLHRYVLDRTPEAHAVRCNLAAFLVDSGRVDEAIEELERVLACRPDHWKARSTLASALQQQGRSDEALAQLEQSVRLNPEQFSAQYNLGLMLFERGRLAEAVACYEAARQQRPDDFRLHVNLGNALLAQGQTEAALACYDEALRLKPGYARGHFNRGVALSRLGRRGEAAAEFRRALEFDPQHEGARRELQALENPAAQQAAP